MRSLIISPPNPSNPTIARHNQNRTQLILQSSIQKGKAFNIQHMNFINEQNTRTNLCFSLLSPFPDFRINLIAHFGFDFSGVAAEES